MRLEVSDQALRDIKSIHHESLTRFGAVQASKYTAGLFNLLHLIATRPEMARVRRGFSKPTRAQRYGSHLVFYRVEQQTIWIVRILHGKQNWQDYF